MRAIREILRQRFEFGRSLREISQSVGASFGAVQTMVERAAERGLSWPLPEDLDDAALEQLLFKQPEAPQGRALPNMEDIDKELRSHKGVTLLLLWEEYKAQHPDGYQYTQFCRYYRAWQGTQEPTMRQVHRFGQRVYLDFAGVTVPTRTRRQARSKRPTSSSRASAPARTSMPTPLRRRTPTPGCSARALRWSIFAAHHFT